MTRVLSNNYGNSGNNSSHRVGLCILLVLIRGKPQCNVLFDEHQGTIYTDWLPYSRATPYK